MGMVLLWLLCALVEIVIIIIDVVVVIIIIIIVDYFGFGIDPTLIMLYPRVQIAKKFFLADSLAFARVFVLLFGEQQ